ncbi:hypothetical protein [Rhodococcus qingshengii]|uniref:hypothetical protein n=1 Tax=Rhodococcus qingshengii TaxID=334542 RepID=UPI0035DB91A2
MTDLIRPPGEGRSSREALCELVRVAYWDFYDQAILRMLLDGCEHDVAQKIRVLASQEPDEARREAMLYAADLVDPEVRRMK